MTALKSGSRRRGRRPAAPLHGTGPDTELDGGEPGYPAQDWSAVEVGTTVEVIPPGGLPYLARVDEKTPDSALVWVLSLDGSGRQLHGNHDGVTLRRAAGPL